jgi:hypothetical protein
MFVMIDVTAAHPSPLRNPWRIAGWGTIATLLSLPAILDFPWTASDFIIMGVLLGSVGLGIEFLVRRSGSVFVRLGSIMVVLTAFLTIWVNLAVGMIGDDEPYNLLFAGVLLVALLGSLLVRLRPGSMVKVTLVAAFLQVAVGLGGYGMDPRGAVFSACFGLFWLLAAALFQAGSSR